MKLVNYKDLSKSFQVSVIKVWLNPNTGSSNKMNGIWIRYNLKSTRRIDTPGILKCSEKFNDLDLP